MLENTHTHRSFISKPSRNIKEKSIAMEYEVYVENAK